MTDFRILRDGIATRYCAEDNRLIALVVRADGQWQACHWPTQGEYSTTVEPTRDAAELAALLMLANHGSAPLVGALDHYPAALVLALAQPNPGDDDRWTRLDLDLSPGQTAWRPDSTKHLATGPARLRYDVHPSGVILSHR